MALAFAMTEPHLSAPPAGPMRTCIATGVEGAPETMIRFVVGPEGEVVPDLARRLPGRGMWVQAERAALERAVEKKLFSRAARAPVKAAADLVKVEQMIGRHQAGLLVVADDADGDGLQKLRATGLPLERLADAAALGGIFGREQAVYVAIARDDAGGAFIERISVGAARWRRFRLNGAG